ncbi:MAG: TRAP transporter small permease subunit [Fusobacteriaceae bacterium]|nr:TRAP transporter small permease subunit [Fusobacteriaceae bacterium]
MGIGTVAMGLLALSVIFTVIMRYCFSLSWKEVSEFNITLFAFTTFWGMGICILRNEHVVIDMLYNKLSPRVKRWMSVLDYGIVLAVDLIFMRYSWAYAKKAGVQISQGMEVPMIFMYGIMPLCALIAAGCIVIRIAEFIRAPLSFFEPREKTESPAEQRS